MLPFFPDAIQNWDVNVLNWIQTDICTPFLDILFPVLTLFGQGGVFWIAVAFIFLFFKKTRKAGIMMGVAMILGISLGNGIVKNVVGRIRPYELEGALKTTSEIVFGAPTDASFPSGHSLASFECATALMYYNRKVGIPALILAVGVALSRMYMYIHFPTDVIGGIILGIIFGILGVIIVNLVYKAIEKKTGISLE